MNKLRQPLVLNLNDGTSIHLLAKDKVEITSEQFKSDEIKLHLEKDEILVLRMS
jgi:hypothetical protein